MKHARADYNRIQDPAGLIPEDEPVFMLRARDLNAPDTVRDWAARASRNGAADNIVVAALRQARAMEEYAGLHYAGGMVPDMPEES